MLLSQAGNIRNLALFSLAIDSSLRGVDLVRLKVGEVYDGRDVLKRGEINQSKTRERVSFSMSDFTREALKELIEGEKLGVGDYLFTSQSKGKGKPLSPTHYRRMLNAWLEQANIDPKKFGSHSLRRSKVSLIYKKTGNLRVAQLLLGHKSIENTKNYLGIEQDEALGISEQFDSEI